MTDKLMKVPDKRIVEVWTISTCDHLFGHMHISYSQSEADLRAGGVDAIRQEQATKHGIRLIRLCDTKEFEEDVPYDHRDGI